MVLFPMHAQEEVTGFAPRPDDLDYPGKLQRLASKPEAASLDAEAEQQPLMASNGNAAASDPSVSNHACLSCS